MEKLIVSLAYKYVMLTLMLADANHALQKLDVRGMNPIATTNIVDYHITPPRMRVGGSIDTTNMMLGFGENKLQFIQFSEPNSDLDIEERHNRWAKMKSLIDTNGAYDLATNWLTKLDVDVPALEKAHPRNVMQNFYYQNGDPNKKIMLPRFEIRWGTNQTRPAVWVSIFGPTKSPIHIRQEDSSFIRRNSLIRTNQIENLLSIPNRDFAKWTIQQKSNLVTQSAGNVYPSLRFPEITSIDSRSQKSSLPFQSDSDRNKPSQKRTKIALPTDQNTPK